MISVIVVAANWNKATGCHAPIQANGDNTFETVTFVQGHGVNLVLLENSADWYVLLEQTNSEVNLVGYGSTVDLNFHISLPKLDF